MTNPKDSEVPAHWRVPQWFPNLNKKTLDCLHAYHQELIRFNKRINLISPKTELDADAIHVSDAILAAGIILKHTKMKEVYDIGSGNGIPGIIMAILAEDRPVRLVDSDTRKIEFLKHCIAKLNLKNCFATHARAETLGEGVISCGVCRGFASVTKTLLGLRKIAAPGCELFHLKGEAWAGEVAEVPAQILASWEPKFLADYTLPDLGTKLSVIVTVRR